MKQEENNVILSPPYTHYFRSFEDVSMEGNQNSNPLDYSQSGGGNSSSSGGGGGITYKDLNGNGTAASNIKSNEFVDQNGIKSPSAALGQVKTLSIISPFFLLFLSSVVFIHPYLSIAR